VWTPKRIWEKINYIHANPVRLGLADRPEDWIWSSSRDFAGTREAAWRLSIYRDTLPFIVA
jgi:hypothetical protein